MGIISEKFNSKINSLRSAFEENRDVIHQGIKGGLNESELSSLIIDVIPRKYQISKGIIENSSGKQSNETDLFIYDDEILPPYIKNELAFVPVEAVKYIFEVKSTLNSTELKTTIEKFKNFKSIGGRSPSVLFSFSSDIQGSELSRYKKNDPYFYTHPSVTVFCVSNKSYYFFDTSEHYLKDYLSIDDLMTSHFNNKDGKGFDSILNVFSDVMKEDQFLDQLTRSQFALCIKSWILSGELTKSHNDKNLTINGIEFSSIKFKIHKWIGVESSDNDVDLSFLSGISNTLSKESFGNYLLNRSTAKFKNFSICYEDMWGNLSCQDFNEKGLSYNPDNVNFSFKSNSESNEILFKIKE